MIARSVRPAGLLVPTIVASVALVLRAPSTLRLLPVIVALVAVPGAVVVRHMRPAGRSTAAAVGAAAGLAWLVLASEVLVYTRWWKPAVLLPASLLFSSAVALVPIQRAAHSIRRGWDRRVTAGLLIVSTGLVTALQAIAIRQTPYSSTELRTLQSAYVRATEGTLGRGPGPSMLSALAARLIPFQRATVGTMLASRWLQLGIAALVVALAACWVSNSTERRGRAAVWAVIVASGAAVFLDSTRPDALLAAAALMAAGCWLAPDRDDSTRPGWAGVLLGAAALGSRTCALAAAALVIRELLVGSTGGQLRMASTWVDRRYRLLAGLVCGAGATMASAGLLGVRPGALTPAGAPFWGEAFRVAPMIFALLCLAVVLAARRLRPAGQRGLHPNLPLVAFGGAAVGAALELDPTIADLAIPTLLLAAAVARSVWFGATARPGPTTGLPARRRFGWQIAASVLAVGIPIGARSIEMPARSNDGQVDRIAYILDHTGKNDAVFDPSGTVGVLRRQVDRSDIAEATFAVLSPAAVSRDPELAGILRTTFEPTRFSDVWRAVLVWSPPAPSPSRAGSIK